MSPDIGSGKGSAGEKGKPESRRSPVVLAVIALCMIAALAGVGYSASLWMKHFQESETQTRQAEDPSQSYQITILDRVYLGMSIQELKTVRADVKQIKWGSRLIFEDGKVYDVPPFQSINYEFDSLGRLSMVVFDARIDKIHPQQDEMDELVIEFDKIYGVSNRLEGPTDHNCDDYRSAYWNNGSIQAQVYQCIKYMGKDKERFGHIVVRFFLNHGNIKWQRP